MSGAFLQDMAPVAIQSYYTNYKGAAFTLGLITVMRIKSHFAAAFQDFSAAYFPPPLLPVTLFACIFEESSRAPKS